MKQETQNQLQLTNDQLASVVDAVNVSVADDNTVSVRFLQAVGYNEQTQQKVMAVVSHVRLDKEALIAVSKALADAAHQLQS